MSRIVAAYQQLGARAVNRELKPFAGERGVPIISMFYGIVIRMYYFDDKQLHVAYVHVEYAGQ